MSSEELFSSLALELCQEILRIASWAAAEVDKPWLCSIATTSRLVWSIVYPILYDTVCLSTEKLECNIDFARTPGFALTRRLYCNTIRAPAASIAPTFGGVEHFAGWSPLFFKLCLCDDPSARFSPTLASLSCNQFTAPERPSCHAQLCRLTHLHLMFKGAFSLPGGVAPLPGDCALRFVVLEAAEHDEARPAGLVDSLLPFFAHAAALERILVRISLDASQAAETLLALNQYARATGEQRLWTFASPTPASPAYQPGISFSDAKWTAGRRLASLKLRRGPRIGNQPDRAM